MSFINLSFAILYLLNIFIELDRFTGNEDLIFLYGMIINLQHSVVTAT